MNGYGMRTKLINTALWGIAFIAVTPVAAADPAQPRSIVEQNYYYPKPGLEDEVLRTREEASRIRQKIGLGAGRILVQNTPKKGAAYVIWQNEYETIGAREADMQARAESKEFEAIRAKMRTLIDNFERTVWIVYGEDEL